MKRSPLKRSPFKRKGAKKTDAPQHLAYLRTLPCCLGQLYACSDVVQSHHSTVSKGMSLRTSDLEAFPLCSRHHRDFHDHAGFFAGWSKDQRKAWQLEQSNKYRTKETG